SPGPAFGWGKPVVFNPYNLKNPKRDAGLVALAGPVSNIILASLSILILYLTKDPLLLSLLIPFIQLNVVLAVFNLIPIYPLDGYNIMVAFLPHHLSEQFQETSRYGVYILLLLVLTGAISKILYPVLSLVQYLINTLVF
ncbi:MAG TPA: site-2 protease family protein, partial [candidate division WWE3 bacterium]|nr:site-2 protease family protein [candidate division WWE3 bacterium]